MASYVITRSDELYHFGIKGQKWGVRRFENEDGTLTDEGKIRYAKSMRDANQYKTAKERLKTIGKAGKTGAALGAGLVVGEGAAISAKNIISKTHGSYIGSINAAAQLCAALIAAPAVGGIAVSAIHQGYQAAKVKRGQNFIEKYKSAFEKTYGG